MSGKHIPAKGRAQAREQPFKGTELPRANIRASTQHLLPFTGFDLRASSASEKFSISDQRQGSE